MALLFIAAGLFLLLWDAPPAWLPWRSPASLIGLPLQSAAALGAAASAATWLALFLFFLKRWGSARFAGGRERQQLSEAIKCLQLLDTQS